MHIYFAQKCYETRLVVSRGKNLILTKKILNNINFHTNLKSIFSNLLIKLRKSISKILNCCTVLCIYKSKNYFYSSSLIFMLICRCNNTKNYRQTINNKITTMVKYKKEKKKSTNYFNLNYNYDHMSPSNAM